MRTDRWQPRVGAPVVVAATPGGRATLRAMGESSQPSLSLVPLAWTLLGYLALQVLLNVINGIRIRRAVHKMLAALTGSFWGGVIGALYLVVLSALLHIWRLAPNTPQPPANMLWQGLCGLPLGAALWYLVVMARKLGIAVFGPSQLLAAEDVILRTLPAPRYLGWGVINLAVIQPLGRELFMRGVLLPLVAMSWGWGPAVVATLVIEFLLRLNVVWVFATGLYALAMCGLFYLTGNALCGLVAASVAGLIHGVALAYTSLTGRPGDRAEAGPDHGSDGGDD